MGILIVAVTVGFLLGVLLMILLVTGREEEDLLDRLEASESSRGAPRNPEVVSEPVAEQREDRVPPRRP